MAYIKKFEEISRKNVSEVGGKAASLGEMTQIGLPVPLGFVITTEAFQKPINEGEIFNAFDQLHAEKVSVRSSAVAEDSSSASWAGQLETYLNVSRKDLTTNIKKCWESVKSERAKIYAKEQNLPEDQMMMAVVIQKMVEAKTAGVMFTANPVTSDRNEIMIESILGLGEALVQGSVTPDNFIVDKESLEIKIKDLQEDEQTISDDNIKKLSEWGKMIEDHYGNPQDIEWAIDETNKIWILQSRPITTL